MINRILMELYDEYANENIEPLKKFSNITFANKNASIVFMGCTLIMFSKVRGLKPRYLCTREELLEIVLSIKKKISNTNLLEFYLDRINTKKGIKKYFKEIRKNGKLEEGADIVIDYLEQFRPKFISSLQSFEDKIKDYKENKLRFWRIYD